MMRKLLYSFLFFTTSYFTFGQSPATFSTPGTSPFIPPAGVTILTKIESWGAGGAGGMNNDDYDNGGGGGGGGYSVKTTTTNVANTTYNITVGAGGTPSANSGKGGNTTAAFLTNVIGNGGNGGTSAQPGIGGTGGGGTGGGTNRTGGNGSNGSNLNYGGGGGSSAGTGSNGNSGSGLNGGAVVTGGGAGANGAGISGGNGNSATGIGGGGGGGRSPATGNYKSGGNGANGQVTLTYTCPSYALTSTAVSSSTICSGTPVTVTLKHTTPSNLPLGTYTVTYNVGTALASTTATMTVSSAGTGTFSTPNLFGSGGYTITITKIESGTGGTCVNTAPTNNTVGIAIRAAFTAGTISSAGETICSGGNPALIGSTTDAAGGNTIITYKWQANGVDIAGTNAATYDPPTGLTTTTTYTRFANDGTCNTTPTLSAGSWLVTVRPVFTAGTISSAGETICSGGNPALIGSTTDAAGGNTIITYKWQANGVNIAGANAATYDPPTGLTTTTTYTRFANDGTCNTTPTLSAGSWLVTVRPIFTAGTISSAGETICSGGNPALIGSTTDAAGGNTIITYKWQANGVNIAGANAATYDPPTGLTTTTTYTRFANDGTCNTTPTLSAGSWLVTVRPVFTAGTISSAGETICSGGNPALIGSTTDAAGGNTIITYKWQANGVDIAGTNAATYDPPTGLTTTTTYTRFANDGTCNTTPTLSAGSWLVTVRPVFTAGTISSAGETICSGGNPALIGSTTDAAGGNTIITYKWQANGVDIAGANAATYDPPTGLTTTTTYTRFANDGTCNTTPTLSAGSWLVTVRPVFTAGTISSAGETICSGGNPALIGSTTDAAGGNTIITYKWQANGVDIAGTNAATYDPPTGLTTTTTYTRFANDGTCNTTPTLSAGSWLVTVRPVFTAGTISSAGETICSGGNPALIGSTTDAAGGNTIITYKWQANGVDIAGTNAATYDPPTGLTTTTTYTRFANDGTCNTTPTLSAGSWLVTVRPVFTAGTISSAGETICSGGNPALIGSTTDAAGGNTIITYKWQANGVDIAGANAATYDPPTGLTTTTTYTRFANDGTCNTTPTLSAGSWLVTVTQYPSITTEPQPLPICENGSGSFTFVPSTPAQSYQWQYLDGSTWTNTDGAVGVTGHNTTSLDLTNVPLSYNGYFVRCILTNGTCSVTTTPTQLTVNALPVAPTATVTIQPTCAVPTGVITVSNPAQGSGFEYSLDGTTFVSSATFTGVAIGPHDIKVKNTSTGCESAITSLNVNSPSTKQWNGSVDSKWNTAANWTPTGIPAIGDCVEIPDTTTDPIIDTTNINYNVHALTVNTNGSLTVGSTNTLTVTNAVTVLGSGATAGALIFENNSSLLQTNTASNINIGNITYKRDTAPLRHYDLTYWSSPVTATPGFTLSKLSPNTLRDKYYSYNSSTDLWVTEYDGLAVMAPGRGYNLRAPISFDVITSKIYKGEFVGVPNNGDVTLVTVPGKWSLGGNPYPSAINGRKFISDNGTKVGTIYFWTHTTTPTTAYPGDEKYNYNSDDFASMNLSGETAATTLLSSIPSTYIAAGVGFFFKAGPGTTVTYTNDMRVTGKNEQFFKTDQAEATDRSRVWLNLTNTQGAFKQLLVAYANGATNNWDANYDAQTLNGNSYIDFYSINGSTKLTIQGRALPFDNSDEVILGYKSVVASDFTIAIDHVDGLFTDQPVYLEDKVTGKIQNLTAGNYTFTTAIGTFTERFVLRYTNKTLGTGDLENLEDTLFVSVKDKAIKVTSSKETIKDVVIYDVSGKQLYDKKKIGTTELQISNLQSSNQVLLVKVTLENGFTTTRKIIFQ